MGGIRDIHISDETVKKKKELKWIKSDDTGRMEKAVLHNFDSWGTFTLGFASQKKGEKN